MDWIVGFWTFIVQPVFLICLGIKKNFFLKDPLWRSRL